MGDHQKRLAMILPVARFKVGVLVARDFAAPANSFYSPRIMKYTVEVLLDIGS